MEVMGKRDERHPMTEQPFPRTNASNQQFPLFSRVFGPNLQPQREERRLLRVKDHEGSRVRPQPGAGAAPDQRSGGMDAGLAARSDSAVVVPSGHVRPRRRAQRHEPVSSLPRCQACPGARLADRRTSGAFDSVVSADLSEAVFRAVPTERPLLLWDVYTPLSVGVVGGLQPLLHERVDLVDRFDRNAMRDAIALCRFHGLDARRNLAGDFA